MKFPFGIRATLPICCLLSPVLSLSQQSHRRRTAARRFSSSGPPPDDSQERRQQSLNVGNNPLLSLNMNLDALARAQAAERAQELYQRISALHREGYYAVSPDVVSFNSVLKAWSDDPARALEFWEEEVDKLSVPNKPNVRSYNAFLLSLANTGLYDSAESLLEQMSSPDSIVIPDRISYNTVLLSYLLSSEPSVSARADQLLREMIDSPDIDPDIVSFNTVIATWAAHREPKTAARRAEAWLREIKQTPGVSPDVYTYSTVLHAWSRCGRSRETKEASAVASQRARELLQEMQDSNLEPNRITYTIVMQTLCESGRPQEAHDVLRDMLEMAATRPEVRPDCVAFSALMDGYAKQASYEPQETLSACCRILKQMKDLSREWPDVAPNARTYTSMFKALAQSRQPDAGKLAEAFLEEMWQSEYATPNVIHYNAALDVYAKSPLADKAVRASLVWKNMRERGIPEDTITYNTLLATTAHVFGSSQLKKDGLRMGLKVFEALHDDGDCQPTTLSYHYLFKTIRKLMPESPERKDAAKHAFHLCCEQGCLNDMVLGYVIKHLISEKELLGERSTGVRSTSVRDFPTEWSCNAMGIRPKPNKRIGSGQPPRSRA